MIQRVNSENLTGIYGATKNELERKEAPMPLDKPFLPENNLEYLERRKKEVTIEIHDKETLL